MELQARDPYLWQKAKARTKFQSHLLIYGLVNGSLWLLWALTPQGSELLPWPIWTTAFWGFGLLTQGLAVYAGHSRSKRTQREYDRLLRDQQGSY
ncbi:2TM domain-containing protein [Hymenobacter nivis]|uniref:2TM domain-containing protein n=1 Tax=Hymenobacter nivis TaxID=1850093 RepID=A0A2Z3GZG4_9BACT|nr:2TM domain-containing protein [Hymenobacter nivis]AWM34764.1 hypothetical protein DDQ68_19480 [Hymenobacter nivis]